MQTLKGKVVSAKGEKTAIVVVESFAIHPKYQKRMKRSSRFLIHDEIGLHEGDTVTFTEVRPLSKMKRWKAVEVVK